MVVLPGRRHQRASLYGDLAVQPTLPKNIFNEYGFSIGGPVYIPKILTGRDKLFFFQDFDRTTRRQLITGTQTVPTTALLTGDFSAVLVERSGQHHPLRSAARRHGAVSAGRIASDVPV